ncbi:unnamed protein product [Adineta ricciae]|nr:unnamed protein product [Adineta ricciae]
MLPFKQAYANHKFHVIVDNVRTHSAKHYSVEDFGMKPGTRCKTDKIFYRDEDGKKTIYRLLFLQLVATKDNQKAYSSWQKNLISKLEMVANDYGVAVSFSPKFHCELNPIEGLWAYQKQFVRSRTDQTFPTMLKLIQKSRINFIEKNVSLKLIRRFWRTLVAYKRGDSYEDVLKMYSSSMCTANVISHRQITNSNLDN